MILPLERFITRLEGNEEAHRSWRRCCTKYEYGLDIHRPLLSAGPSAAEVRLARSGNNLGIGKNLGRNFSGRCGTCVARANVPLIAVCTYIVSQALGPQLWDKSHLLKPYRSVELKGSHPENQRQCPLDHGRHYPHGASY